MIAVPADDGGVTVHGSLQCPYYVHTRAQARPRASTTARRGSSRRRPAAGSAARRSTRRSSRCTRRSSPRKAQRPVRMIYDRHEDIAATTKRHPAIVRHRTGVTRDGRLLAQDIEVVMDGGAYCTLTPVVLSRGAIHAGGPYRCPNVRIRARATRTNTPPNGAFRGFGAPQTEFAAETHLNRIAEALGHLARSTSAGGTSTASATRRRPARSCATAWPARRSSSGPPRRPSSSGCGRDRDAPGRARRLRHDPGSPLRTGRDRVASGIGLALAWHGAGFTGSGEVKLASVASLELTAEGRIRHPDRLDRDGAGDQDDLPAARRRGARRPDRRRRDGAAGHGLRARLRADRRVAHGDGRRWAADPGRAAAARRGRGARPAATVRRRPIATTPATHGADPHRPALRAVSGRRLRRRDLPRRRLPGVRLGGLRRDASTSISTPARSTSATSSPPTTSGKVIHPVLAEGQVEGGTLQAVGYATIEEIKLRDGRYLNDRLATYIIPTSLDAPRITTILVEAPFDARPARREGGRGAADGRRGAGRRRRDRRRDRGLGRGPAGQPGADPRGAGRACRGGRRCRPAPRNRRGPRPR